MSCRPVAGAAGIAPIALRVGAAAASPDDVVASRVEGVMEALGLDLEDPHLRDTPLRVARSLRALLSGLRDPEPRLSTFPNPEGYGAPVLIGGIAFHSLCAHHLLPFFGEAAVAYLPGEHLVGLSKPARIVDHFARRPQVQERLTEQVAETLARRLRPRAVAVRLRARHLCMEMRGVEKAAWTVTSAVRGAAGAELLRELAASGAAAG